MNLAATKSAKRKEALRLAMEKVRNKKTGVIKARDVVQAARHPDSILHSHFEWDDGKAAEKYRVVQARQLIRCIIVEAPTNVEAPAYVSLREDRKSQGGGYRRIEDVIESKEYLRSLERQAKTDLEAWARRYDVLRTLVTRVASAADITIPETTKRLKK